MERLMDLVYVLDSIKMRVDGTFYSGFDTAVVRNQPLTNYLLSTKGDVRRSELCRLEYFQIPDNIGCDPFHDIEEGIGGDLIKLSLNALVSNTYIRKCDFANHKF